MLEFSEQTYARTPDKGGVWVRCAIVDCFLVLLVFLSIQNNTAVSQDMPHDFSLIRLFSRSFQEDSAVRMDELRDSWKATARAPSKAGEFGGFSNCSQFLTFFRQDSVKTSEKELLDLDKSGSYAVEETASAVPRLKRTGHYIVNVHFPI